MVGMRARRGVLLVGGARCNAEPRERGRGGGDEAQALAAPGMVEGKDVRVQCQAAEGIRLAAVHRIAGDGMAEPREVHADLISPPRLEPYLEQRVPRAASEDARPQVLPKPFPTCLGLA